MTPILLAAGAIPAWVGEIAIAIIVVLAIIAIVYAVCKGMGLPIPSWLITVVWIVIAAVVGIAGIRFIMGWA